MILSTLAVSLGLNMATAVPPILDQVREDVKKHIDRQEIRAAVVGVQSGAENRVAGFGQLSGQNTETPAPDTVFEIGSITKVFTALLAQQQVLAGNASWDEPISQRISGEFASARVAAITWRELATHTSGLPRVPDNMPMTNPLVPYEGYDRQLLEAYLKTYSPDDLEKTYAYSNLGMGLLGELAADAAGLSYAEAMTRDVFQPLGLADTSVVPGTSQLKRLAEGFSDGADMPRWDGFDALAGAGAVVSTASDMLRFAFLTLHPQQAGAMAPALTAIAQRQGEGETGLGWHINDADSEQPVYWHNGGTGGYASALALNPKTQTAVLLLTASTEYDLVTGLAFTQLKGEVEDSTAALDLSLYEGAYELGPGMVLTVFAEDGKLFAQATGQSAFPLAAGEAHQFSFAAAAIRMTFEGFEDGRASNLSFVQGGQTIPAQRVSDDKGITRRTPIDVGAETLAPLVGEYLLAPGVLITVEARGDQLFVQLTGQSALPVFPFAENQFFYKAVDAELHFEIDDAGTVTGVTLVQGGQQFAPRQP